VKKTVGMIVTNELYPSDIRVFKEAVTLSKKFKVLVILWDRSGKMKNHETFDEIDVFRIRLSASYDKSTSIMLKLPVFWLISFMLLLKLKPDAIHCHDLDTLPVGCLIKIVNRHVKVIFDSHEHYPSMIADIVPSFVKWLVSLLFETLPLLADAIIVVNDYLAEFFKKSKNVVVIMNTPSLHEIEKMPSSKDVHDSFRIFFFGALTLERGLHILIYVAKKLPYVELIIAGDGPEKYTVIKNSVLYSNIKYLGRVSHNEILENMLSSDLIPILYSSDILNNRIATPNKLFLAMSLGKPVVVYKGSLTEQIVKKERIGFSIHCENTQELINLIEILYNQRFQFDEIRKNGQRSFKSFYNWEIMEDRLTSLYEKMF
jgi:glycosyltransferase involved in cell wall biosynthesis